MPYYGVKLDDNFVKTNHLLNNKNTVTVRNSDKELYFFAVPAICGTDTLVTFNELQSVKFDLAKNLENLIEQQDKQVAQTLCDIEPEFFVTVMDY